MAEDRPVTPEKQLLKLIEDPKAASGQKRPMQTRGRSSFSFSGLKGILAGKISFWKRSSKGPRLGSGLDLAIVNRVLALAVLCLFVYVTYDAAASTILVGGSPNVAVNPKPVNNTTGSQQASPLKDSTFYLERIATRDIFKEGPKPVSQPKNNQEAAAPVEELSSQFALVGISWSSSPDVIIENKAEQRTYFVKRGQPVGGGAKVEAVFKDYVILSREGQEFELR